VERRIANTKLDPTFLMADVEIVATYELYNINRTKLENVNFRGSHDQIQIKIQSLYALGCTNDRQIKASLTGRTFNTKDPQPAFRT
jgi:hypothetical protein